MRKWQLLQLVNINQIKLLDLSERGKMPASYMPDFIENIGGDIFLFKRQPRAPQDPPSQALPGECGKGFCDLLSAARVEHPFHRFCRHLTTSHASWGSGCGNDSRWEG
jgi:hypothetical protein